MEILSAWVKRTLLHAVIGFFICGVGAVALGKPHLVVPVVVGGVVGAVCWIIIGYRILKSAGLSVGEAKQSMRFGWLLRLVLIMGTFIAAIRISAEVFWAVVTGLFLMSGIMMVNAIRYAYGSNVGKKK